MIRLPTVAFGTFFVGTALALVPRWIVRSGLEPHVEPGFARYVGLLPIVAGIALILWCWTEFVERGRGTPAPIDPFGHVWSIATHQEDVPPAELDRRHKTLMKEKRGA